MYEFIYGIILTTGYRPTCEDEQVNEIEITIKSKNRATADRAIKALLHDDGAKIDYTYAQREDEA